MKPFLRPLRTPSKLSDSVHRQLNLYALAAGAAGVGVLALAQPADAKITYTKTHQIIEPGGHYDLDLNHDKITDFTLVFFTSTHCPDSCVADLYLKPAAGNSAIGGGGWCAAMNFGSPIGPRGPFQQGRCDLAIFRSTTGHGTGPWYNVKNRYLGLKFKIRGKNHYGWARLSVISATATLTGYAYETIPNKAIIAGKTKGSDVVTEQASTLGRLALGRK